MKPYLKAFLFLSLIYCVPSFAISASDTIDPVDLIKRVETQYQGRTSHGIARMHIKTSAWERTLTMESWTMGRERFLTRILKPRKERGTATLKVENNIWNYLPKIDRLIKIPSSLMGDSWMGSHLTNDDLVKEDKVDKLFCLKVASRTKDIAVIIGVPKPDAAVVWGKIIYKINLTKKIPVYIDYYDEDGEAVRRITFSEVSKIDGRSIPMKMMVKPFDKPNEFTELIYEKIEFGVKIKKDVFSIRTLRKH